MSSASASALVNDAGLDAQQKQALEKAKEQITKVLQKDGKVEQRDLHDLLQKQARIFACARRVSLRKTVCAAARSPACPRSAPAPIRRRTRRPQARSTDGCMYDDANRDAPATHKRPALVEAPGGFVPMPTSLKQVFASRAHTPSSRAPAASSRPPDASNRAAVRSLDGGRPPAHSRRRRITWSTTASWGSSRRSSVLG